MVGSEAGGTVATERNRSEVARIVVVVQTAEVTAGGVAGGTARAGTLVIVEGVVHRPVVRIVEGVTDSGEGLGVTVVAFSTDHDIAMVVAECTAVGCESLEVETAQT